MIMVYTMTTRLMMERWPAFMYEATKRCTGSRYTSHLIGNVWQFSETNVSNLCPLRATVVFVAFGSCYPVRPKNARHSAIPIDWVCFTPFGMFERSFPYVRNVSCSPKLGTVCLTAKRPFDNSSLSCGLMELSLFSILHVCTGRRSENAEHTASTVSKCDKPTKK